MSKLFIICGHGAGDPGACKNGFQEAERVRALAQRIKYFGGDSVIIGDTSKNWYKSNLISTLEISKDVKLLELHMNSYHLDSAKGGHVIIQEGLKADKYDKALAEFMSKILPGRKQTIVSRNNLANPKRAKAKGYNYRLLECGFISNKEDLAIFNGNMDLIAKGILKCFGIIPVEENPKPKYFLVKVKVRALNYRQGPGTEYLVKGTIRDKGTYTIINTAKAKDGGTWGDLLSGAGWINISDKYVKRV